MMRTKTPRPRAVTIALTLLVFLGLTAIGGGIEMFLFPHGNQYVPGEWIDGVPFIDSWVLPGLVLALGFGVGSLVVGWGMFRRPRFGWQHARSGLHWSWTGCILVGLGLLAWTALELVFIPKRSVVEAIYGAIGLALVILPLLPSARTYLRPSL